MSELFLIVGLGNPGLEYSKTRHNVGFMFVDYLVNKLKISDLKRKFDSLYSDALIDINKIIIIKPQNYMNLSGQAVRQFAEFYKIRTENIFVIQDDLDLKPQDIRIKFSGSSGGHNGIKNIDANIGQQYWRIRIGIGRPEQCDVKDYVLSNFTEDELNNKLPKLFEIISCNITNLLFQSDKIQVISQIKNCLKNDR